MEDDKLLKIGDYITLQSLKFLNFLSAEGILNPEVTLSDELSPFDSNIFCVHLPRQYSAQMELDDFVDQHGDDAKMIEDIELKNYLGSLKVNFYLI